MAFSKKLIIPKRVEDATYQSVTWSEFDQTADNDWTTDLDTGGTATLSTAYGNGQLRLNTGTTLNTGCTLLTNGAFYGFFADRELFAAARFALEDITADKANMLFGFINGADKDILLDSGAGVETGKEHALIYKVEDNTKWICQSGRTSTTPLNTQSEQDAGQQAADTTAFQTLAVKADVDGDWIKVRYFLDPFGFNGLQPLTDSFGKPIVHQFSQAGSITNMYVALSLKNGTTTAEQVYVDWWTGQMSRGDAKSA